MTAEQIDRYRLILEGQLAQLAGTSETHGRLLDESHVTNDFVGADRAAELETFEVDASVAASEHRLAAKIRHALSRISGGTYGLCEGCGDTIPAARLEAKPSVSLCLACQEAHESESESGSGSGR